MRNTNYRRGLSVALLTWALSISCAWGHLMPAGKGTLNVVGDKAYIVLALPVNTLATVPACADGTLTPAEMKAHGPALKAAIRAGLHVSSDAPATLGEILLNLPTGYGHDPRASAEVTVMIVAQLGHAPKTVTLTSSLWADPAEPFQLRATVTKAGKTVKREKVTLTKRQPSHTFFADAEPPRAPAAPTR